MKVGFYLQGSSHHEMARYFVASVRRAMPDVHIAQLTDATCEALPDIEVIRIPEPMPMGIRRVLHYSQLEGDWCLCGVDVLFRKDVREVFDKPFDVALATRDGTYMQNAQYTEYMPHNFDVVFSRSPTYWEGVLSVMRTMSPEAQEWGAEQLVTCAFAKTDYFRVEIIPSTYNFTPKRETDDVSHVSVLHLKGPRKKWIPRMAEALGIA